MLSGWGDVPSRRLGTDMLGTCIVPGHPTPAGSCQQGGAEGDQGNPPIYSGLCKGVGVRWGLGQRTSCMTGLEQDVSGWGALPGNEGPRSGARKWEGKPRARKGLWPSRATWYLRGRSSTYSCHVAHAQRGRGVGLGSRQRWGPWPV